MGFPHGSAIKESICDAGDPDLAPLSVRSPGEVMATHSKILARESPGQRILAGYSPWGHKDPDATEHAPNVPTKSVRLLIPDS